VPRVTDWDADQRVVGFTDPEDPRLRDYTGLRESTLRRRGSAFIAEGELVVRRAADAGYVPRSFLLAPRWVDALRDVWSRFDVPVYVGEAGVVESLTGFHVHRGALAAYEREERYDVASLMALKPGFGNANYAASKAGLIALTKAAAKELGRFHITVNAVLPGFHNTGMASGLSAEHKKKVIADHVTGQSTRMEDLCRVVLELAQNPSVSGQVFNVDSRVV